MIVSWPSAIKDRGAVRSQFHHAIDVMPTIMDVVGISEPKEVNGYIQCPIDGVSFAYTFDAKKAKAPSTRTQQYFELLGNRAMYRDGWIACCRHGRLLWETSDGHGTTEAGDRYGLMKVSMVTRALLGH